MSQEYQVEQGGSRKYLAIAAVALAVVAAAVAAIVVSIKRADTARLRAEAAASAEAKAESERKIAKSKADEAEIKRKTAEENRKKEEVRQQAAAEESRAATETKLAQESRERTAKSEAAKANAEAEAAKAKSATAKAEAAKAEAEAAKAKAEAEKQREITAEAEAKLAIEKTKSEKTIAEAKIREDTYNDYITWQQTLIDKEQELNERERALKPEKTITDLAWAGGMEDSVADDKGNIVKVVKQPYDASQDRELPRSSRLLAKCEQERQRAFESGAGQSKTNVISLLTALYEQSLREDRVVDAEYIRRSIKAISPEWVYGK